MTGSEIILVFILDYSQEKLMPEFFKKSKKTHFGVIWGLFAQIWAKMNFLGKRALSVSKYSTYLPSFQKSEKTKEPFLRKMSN